MQLALQPVPVVLAPVLPEQLPGAPMPVLRRPPVQKRILPAGQFR